jgi:hypothetical protein
MRAIQNTASNERFTCRRSEDRDGAEAESIQLGVSIASAMMRACRREPRQIGSFYD